MKIIKCFSLIYTVFVPGTWWRSYCITVISPQFSVILGYGFHWVCWIAWDLTFHLPFSNTECSPGFSLLFQGCVKLCPPGFTSGLQLLNLSLENWVDLSSVQACLPCHPTCLTCSGTGPTDCLSCPPHSHLVLTSCLHQNQIQRKSPLAGGLHGDGAQQQGGDPAAADDNSGEDEEPPGLSIDPSSQLPAIVAVLSCILILASFVGVFLLLQMRSGGTALGWRTKLPPVYSQTRGMRVGFGFGFGQEWERKARMVAYESESDSEEVDGHSERTAFIKTQSLI